MIPWRKLSFGRGFTAGQFARYFFLRLLPFPRVRGFGAWLIGRSVTLRHRQTPPREVSPEILDVADQLKVRGFAPVAPVLTNSQIDAILAYLAHQPAYDGERELFASPETTDALRAQYRLDTIVRCPHLLAAINTPSVLAVAERFLGCKPSISAIGLHWSFPSSRTPADVQSFHRDAEAWRLLNMFVYLTDVDEGSGPHRYVFGSQRTRGTFRLTPYPDKDVLKRYGPQNVHTIVGPRGTTFIENGWGIHEGHPPRNKARLMLAVMYSVGPIPVYDYERSRVTVAHEYDDYVNRLLVRKPVRPTEIPAGQMNPA